MGTGRAGWMGMGRGAGRSALGFWPTLAFLFCSFPAGKAWMAPGAGTASQPSPRPPRAGRRLPPPPTSGGPGLPSPTVFVSPAPRGRRDGCPGDSTGGDPTRAALQRSRSEGSLGPEVPPNFPERRGTRDAPLGGPEGRGAGEARAPSRGRFPGLLTHRFADLPGAQGWPPGEPPRS